jgi:large subunit ribosomal protein L17
MRHRVMGRTLGRRTNHRRAMFRNMTKSLLMHGQITTTLPKAKAVKPFAEKMISLAKKGDLASRRRVLAELQDQVMVRYSDDENVDYNRYGEVTGGPKVVKHLFDEIAPRYADRTGGYTRIIKLSKRRLGDGTDLCVLQLVGDEEGPQVGGRPSRRRAAADKRMQRAAELRKQRGAPPEGAPAAADADAPADDAPVEAAAADPINEGGESGDTDQSVAQPDGDDPK